MVVAGMQPLLQLQGLPGLLVGRLQVVGKQLSQEVVGVTLAVGSQEVGKAGLGFGE